MPRADRSHPASPHRSLIAQRPPRRWLRRLAWALAAAIALILAGVLTFTLSPWPGAFVIRIVFNRDAENTTRALERHTPSGVVEIRDQQYRSGDSKARLDVYFPESSSGPMPTVIWTHGGAWISGDKNHYSTYYRLIAAAGFTVVSLDYSLGPEHKYPTAVHELNDVHAYLLANAARLHVDPARIALAGDSAGAQLSSQLAAVITDPAFARQVAIVPALRPDQLRAVVLDCGIYDVRRMTGGPGIAGWGANQSIWAYTGTKDFANSAAVEQMSTLFHVTAQFPPTFLTGGNADPLTDTQSKPLAQKLTGLGVPVSTLFYPADHMPKLGHEYQFDLDDADGKAALNRTIEFLREHLS